MYVLCKCSSSGPWEALGEWVMSEWRLNMERGSVRIHFILCWHFWNSGKYNLAISQQSLFREKEKIFKIHLESERSSGNFPKQSLSVSWCWHSLAAAPTAWAGIAKLWCGIFWLFFCQCWGLSGILCQDSLFSGWFKFFKAAEWNVEAITGLSWWPLDVLEGNCESIISIYPLHFLIWKTSTFLAQVLKGLGP